MPKGYPKKEINIGWFKKGHKIHLGRNPSKEMRKKISKSLLGNVPWNKGLKGFMAGDKNPAWKGGFSANSRAKFHATHPKPDRCEICGIFEKELKRKLGFDHNHKTGKFRGWLCGRCNLALGLVKENTEILYSMIEYIKKTKDI